MVEGREQLMTAQKKRRARRAVMLEEVRAVAAIATLLVRLLDVFGIRL